MDTVDLTDSPTTAKLLTTISTTTNTAEDTKFMGKQSLNDDDFAEIIANKLRIAEAPMEAVDAFVKGGKPLWNKLINDEKASKSFLHSSIKW